MRIIFLLIISVCFFQCSDTAIKEEPIELVEKNSKVLIKKEKRDEIERDTFMDDFLNALLFENRDVLDSYIDFPIIVRGSLDSDVEKEVFEKEFYSIFLNLFLEEKNVCGEVLLNNKSRFNSKSCIRKKRSGSEYFIVDKFLFQKSNEKWILNTIYSEFYNDPKNLE